MDHGHCPPLPLQIAGWATEAYFKHGGDPHFVFPTTLGPSNQITGSPAMTATPTNLTGTIQTPQQVRCMQ